MGSPGRRRNVLRLAKGIGALGDLRDVGRKAGTIWKGVLNCSSFPKGAAQATVVKL